MDTLGHGLRHGRTADGKRTRWLYAMAGLTIVTLGSRNVGEAATSAPNTPVDVVGTGPTIPPVTHVDDGPLAQGVCASPSGAQVFSRAKCGSTETPIRSDDARICASRRGKLSLRAQCTLGEQEVPYAELFRPTLVYRGYELCANRMGDLAKRSKCTRRETTVFPGSALVCVAASGILSPRSACNRSETTFASLEKFLEPSPPIEAASASCNGEWRPVFWARYPGLIGRVFCNVYWLCVPCKQDGSCCEDVLWDGDWRNLPRTKGTPAAQPWSDPESIEDGSTCVAPPPGPWTGCLPTKPPPPLPPDKDGDTGGEPQDPDADLRAPLDGKCSEDEMGNPRFDDPDCADIILDRDPNVTCDPFPCP